MQIKKEQKIFEEKQNKIISQIQKIKNILPEEERQKIIFYKYKKI